MERDVRIRKEVWGSSDGLYVTSARDRRERSAVLPVTPKLPALRAPAKRYGRGIEEKMLITTRTSAGRGTPKWETYESSPT
jgi:hypothetical protein